MFPPIFVLIYLHLLRILRGWRWRAMLFGSVAGAYWFGRNTSFGEGSSAWFCGERGGLLGFTVYFALVSLILGIDAIGQWTRHRARRHLDSRLVHPFRLLIGSLLAIALSMALPAAIVSFWAPVGAWRAGFVVFWSPNLYYFLLTLLPLILAAAAAGMMGRSLTEGDLSALFLGAIAMAPVLYHRLEVATALEFFELGSQSLGILVPSGVLLSDVMVVLGWTAILLGFSALTIPRPRAQTTGDGSAHFLSPDIPILRGFMAALAAQVRQWRWTTVLAAGTLTAVGALGALPLLWETPRFYRGIEWGAISAPQDTPGGYIPFVEILSREANFPGAIVDGITLSLELRGTVHQQRLAALDFGEYMRPAEAQDEGGRGVELVPALLGRGHSAVALKFTPPLAEGEVRKVTVQLQPRADARRLAQRIWHPRFRRLAPLGRWYGESYAVDFNAADVVALSQPAPFRIELPDAEPLSWLAGSATARLEGGRVVVESPLPTLPDQLMAAEMIRVAPPNAEVLQVALLVQPGRRRLADDFHRIYSETFTRLERVFGQPPVELVFYEIPDREPGDPMAISSSQLDRLDHLLPFYDDYRFPSKYQFREYAPELNRALVRAYIFTSFRGFTDRALMGDALAEYLHRYALAQGRTAEELGIKRQDIHLVPWQFASGDKYPFDPGKNLAGWEGTLVEKNRLPGLAAIPPERRLAFHHLVRGVVGDEAYRNGLHRLFQDYRGSILSPELYRQVLEESSGRNLQGLFREWVVDGVMPEYQILRAQAFLTENPDTRALEYRTEVRVTNTGTGSMAVAWELATEQEPLKGRVDLPPGTCQDLSLKTLDRPVVFELDPEGWIPQKRPTKGEKLDPRPRALFKTVTQL